MKPETKSAIENMKSLADLVREAREAANPGLIVGRPKGGITIAEYAGTDLSNSAARRALYCLVAEGKYKKLEALAPTSEGGRIKRLLFFIQVKR